jgi:6-phosphogluconolactonase
MRRAKLDWSYARRLAVLLPMSVATLVLQGCGGGSENAPAPFETAAAAGGATSGMRAAPTSSTLQVAGSVSGLTGSGLVLELNGTQDVSIIADGSFIFPAGIADGSAYSVTVKTQPTAYREFCMAANSSGTIAENISNIVITCSNLAGFLYWGASGGSAASNGSITSYGIQAGTGALLPLGHPTSIDNHTIQLLAAPSGHFLYSFSLPMAGVGVIDFSIFVVNASSGSLSLEGTVATQSPVTAAAMAPSGSYMFAGTEDGSVITFAVDAATGALNNIGSAKLATAYAANMDNIAVTPDGQYVYVLQTDGSGAGPGMLNIFSVNANTGTLVSGSAMTLKGLPLRLAMDPLGRFLYVTNDALTTPFSSASTVTTYSINASTGALSQIVPALTLSGNSASLTAEQSGRFLYIVSSYNLTASDDTITVLSIDQNSGALTQLGPSQSIGSNPIGVVTDHSGEFVYVANQAAATGQSSWSDVTGYSVSQRPATLGQLTQSGSGTQISSDQLIAGRSIAIVE